MKITVVVTIVILISFVKQSLTTDNEDDVLDKLFEEFWDWRMVDSPRFMSRKGFHKHDDLLASYSIHEFQNRKKKVNYFRDKLNSITYGNLSDNMQLEYDIFKDYTKTFIEGYRWKDYQALNPVNFIEGLQRSPGSFMTASKFISRGDFENYIARLEALPSQINDIKEAMTRAVEVRRTYHKVSVLAVPGQIRRHLTGNPMEFILFKPFNETLEDITWISSAVKSDLRRRGKYACSEIINSWQRLSAFIENVYMAKTRPTYGVIGWDRGRKFYKACLKFHLSVDLSPEEVHNIGVREVARTKREMEKIFKKLGHKGNISEFLTSLKNDSRFFRETQEELLDMYRQIADERIEPALHRAFNNIEVEPLRIEPMPYDGPTGTYSSGSVDGTRKGTFRVNLNRPSTHMTFTFMALSLHEGNPGHHMQFSMTSKLNIPKYRRYLEMSNYYRPPFQFPFYTSYMEGWGLYAESLGEEMGLYKDDYEMMGRYGADIFRSCRLVVDTGIHYFNWSREQAIEYMLNYTALPAKQLEIEIDRYITWPGQACAYKIGEIKIREIRKKAEDTLGGMFNIKDFHDVFLHSGPVPLRILEQIYDKWINQTKQGILPRKDICSFGLKSSFGFISVILPFLVSYKVYVDCSDNKIINS